MVETGLRLTYSISLIAALSFLGFGLQPPQADWGLMINENRSGRVQPWAVVVPSIVIALLTIGTNMFADGIARAASASTGERPTTVGAGGDVPETTDVAVGGPSCGSSSSGRARSSSTSRARDRRRRGARAGRRIRLGQDHRALALLGHSRPGGHRRREVMLEGRDILGLRAGELRGLRGGASRTCRRIPRAA